ncbi:ferrous iron transport protein B [Parelusimicrobium proximum]|uniref:FeoB small GTPase domain-containing protein n=1 Tax=Parelusimicrobium proximum TaxID=3228953 RepID=UPI003D16D0C1
MTEQKITEIKESKILSALRKGDKGIVESVDLDEKNIKKFAGLGLVKGAHIQVYKSGNPMLLDIAGTSIALGLAMAKKITISDIEHNTNAKFLNKKMLLVGNPNVGKSQVFTRLTGVKAISSNFPGTTVEIRKSHTVFKDFSATIMDIPGIYRLENDNKAEQEASKIIKEGNYDLILYVMEATHLERSLFLALEVLALGKPVVFILNKAETARTNGIFINSKDLSDMLKSPVVKVEAMTGLGFNTLEKEVARAIKRDFLRCGEPNGNFHTLSDSKKWEEIGKIVSKVQTLKHRHPSFMERVAEWCTRPLTGLPIAFLIMIISFFVVRYVGEGLIDLLTPLFEDYYVPFLTSLFGEHADSWWGVLLLGDGENAFGVLTDALQIALIDVMSYVLIFYAVFEFLADLGYLPRLAILLDSMLHKLGMHGYGAIPILMGLGCKVPAVMGVRTLESRREKIIALALIMIIAPCISQTAMIISILSPYSAWYMVIVFGTLIIAGIGAGMGLNKIMKGDSSEMFMEIPAWQLPKFTEWTAKVWYRMKGYLFDAVPMIILGIFIINICEQLGLLQYVADAMRFPVEKMMGLPADTSSVIILGFLRKDVSIALLQPFHLSAAQITVACVFMTMYIPCVATCFVMLKEFGLKITGGIILLTCSMAFVLACLLNLILI